MKITLLAVLLAVLVPTFATAAPCLPGSLSVYAGLGAAGCQIGSNNFFNFGGAPSFSGGTSISNALVQVVPTDGATGPRLDFVLTGNAAANQLLGIAIAYTISGSGLNSAVLNLTGAAATDEGVVSVVEDICRGGVFASDPTNCATPGPVTLVTAQDSLGPSGPDSRNFVVNSFFDVFVDISLDGGPIGTASIGTPGGAGGTVTNQFTRAAVPEPSSIPLVGAGLFAVWALARRRNFSFDMKGRK